MSGPSLHLSSLTFHPLILSSSCGGWNRTNMKTFRVLILPLDDSASILSSSGRRGRTSVAWFKAREPTTSRSPIIFPSGVFPPSLRLSSLGREGESNPRSDPYKRPALTVELDGAAAVQVGPKGFEPSPTGLKVRRAAVTPRPQNPGRAYAFQSCLVHALAPRFQW